MISFRKATVMALQAVCLSGSGQDIPSMRVFANKLLDSRITSTENYDRLIKDIGSGLITEGFGFVRYCDKAAMISTSTYPAAPEEYLLEIHRDVAGILPELSFDDFEFRTEIDSTISNQDNTFYVFDVSLQCNGRKYRHRSHYRLYVPSKDQYFGNKISQQEFYKIFNKILVDNNSAFRLHLVKSIVNNAVDWEQFGIIALTKGQADMLHGPQVCFSPSYENFKTSLTSARIDSAIAEFQELGIFSHLTHEQILIAKERVNVQDNRTLNDVLQLFPGVILLFDTELGNLEAPYKEILTELANISNDGFNPTEIEDGFATPLNNRCKLRFLFNGKSYAQDMLVDDDWIDPRFFDLVDQVAAENKLSGRFWQLYTGGQEVSLIFLSPEQANHLRTNDLLIFADQWQMVEE